MGLFTPWFLAGVLTVGLPIWLHLLKRSKTDPEPFPSLRFFEHREVPSVHRRLDFILLFILRTLMLLLLALLFAQPFIRTLIADNAGDALTIVAVDRSFSMRYAEGVTTRLDQAKAGAQEVLNSVPPNSRAQVLALAGTLQAMTQQINDPAELHAAVEAIEPSDSRASFGELSRYLRTLRETAEVPLEVHLFSDLQESALPPGFLDLRLENGTDLIFHQIGEAQPNWTVENVSAPQRIYDPDQARIAVTVAGFNTPLATRTVSLFLNGNQVAAQPVEVLENGRGSVEFVGLGATYGFNQAEVRIDSADALPEDDRFPFAVERTDPRKVLFIDDGRRTSPRSYFEAALGAGAEDEFSMEALLPQQAATRNLADYALVVLYDLGEVPNRLEDALNEYTAAGGAVLLALGPNSVALSTAPVLDEPIEGSHYAEREGERFWSASDVDTAHPALRSVERFEGVKFYQATTVTPTASQVLARLSDGTPLVLERHIGEGDVLAFTSTFDNLLNDLPLKPIFVGFVQESVHYLAGGGVETQINLPVDSYVDLRTGDEEGVTAEVLGPDGERVLSLEEAANARNFALEKEGFFEVTNAAGRRTLVAAHADRRESDLTVIPEESQQLWRESGGVTAEPEAGGGAEAGELAEQTEPRSLAPILLVLLLGVALVESFVANRYLGRSAQPQHMAP